MTRNLKQLTIAFLAALALTTAITSVASAAEDSFFASKEKAVVTAESEFSFGILVNGGKNFYECEESSLAGTFKSVAKEITMYPTFNKCGATTFESGGCVIRLTGRTEGGGDAPLEIGCPTNFALQFVGEMCTIRIPAQTATGVVYFNGEEMVEGAKRKDVTIKLTLSKVFYEKAPNAGLGCIGVGGSGKAEDGILTGSYTATAYEDISEEPTPENGDEFNDGKVIDFEVK